MKLAPRLAFLLPSLLPACLDFDEQEIRIRYDAERDRLNLLLVYRGIFNAGGSFCGGAPDQLDRILRGERWFALVSNFPFGANIDHMDEPGNDREARLERHLKETVAVENGRFFRDAEGRVCGWQCVRFDHFTELLRLVNDWILGGLADEESREEVRESLRLGDEESGVLLSRAMGKHAPFVLRRGGALAVRFPASSAGHRALVESFIRSFAEEVAKDARKSSTRSTPPAAESRPPHAEKISESEYGIRLLAGAEISFVRSGDWTEIVLGNPERDEQAIRVPRRGGYRDNLEPLLRERNQMIHTDVAAEGIRTEFDSFCKR